MKTFNKLYRLPLGSIRAEGFLKDQLMLSRDGMGGHLFELEPEMIADPFISKTNVKAWSGGDQSGWGAEIPGSYWSGYIQLTFTLDDAEMIAVATNWVKPLLFIPIH